MGSPPRVRGKGLLRMNSRSFGRITPACAGKRFSGSISSARAADHPRVCGEKQAACFATAAVIGSPPRVRGKGCESRCENRPAGITPACAGKRGSARSPAFPGMDHPRVCGEKLTAAFEMRLQQGSPPRVRGKVAHHGLENVCWGITPACAGKRH